MPLSSGNRINVAIRTEAPEIPLPLTPSKKQSGTRGTYLKSLFAYPATFVLCIAIFVPVFRLNHASLSVPLYSGSDAFFYSAVIKNLVENGIYNENRCLGAPGIQEFYDFPLPHATHFALIRGLALLSRNYGTVENLFFLLTFPLTALTSLFVFQAFRISTASATVASLLYAFLPYHWLAGEYHLPYSSYYLVPLLVLVCLWICDDTPLFRFQQNGPLHGGWTTRKGLASIAICALIACDTAYNAFFAAFFLLVAGALSFFRYRSRRSLLAVALLVFVVVSGLALDLTPNFVYFYRHGFNPEVARRKPEESEIYGLKIAPLLLPVSGHRIRKLATLKNRYNQRVLPMWVNSENDWESLGIVGSCGFLLLLGFQLFRCWNHPNRDLLARLSEFNLAGILLSTVGAFGVIFALLISPEIRGLARICVFLAFFAFFAAALALDRMLRLKPALHWGISSLLLGLGLADQTTRNTAPQYQQAKAEYVSDDEFVHAIESRVPANSMIFQLPYVAFPESAPVNKMTDYDLIRGYLHSHTLRWSYGAMRARDTDQWQRSVAQEPTAELVRALTLAGFSGIYIDRFGFTDSAATLESELEQQLHQTPIVSRNLRLSFFPLANFTVQSDTPRAAGGLMSGTDSKAVGTLL